MPICGVCLQVSSISRKLIVMGLALFLALAGSIPVQAQESGDISQREDLVRQRDVLRLQERIRLRSTQGRWQEVIETANELLKLEPGNVTAILNKDRAESKLASGGTAPGVGTEGPYVDPATVLMTPAPSDTGLGAPPSAGELDPFATAEAGTATAPAAETAPSEPKSREEVLALLMGPGYKEKKKPKFNMYAYFSSLAGLVALVGLVGGGIAWMRGKDMSAAQLAASAPSVGRSVGLEDMPTVHGSQPTVPATSPRGGPTQPGYFEVGGKSTSETTMSGAPAAPAHTGEVMYDAVTDVEAGGGVAYSPGAVHEETRPSAPVAEAPPPIVATPPKSKQEAVVSDPSARKSAESVNLGDLMMSAPESSGIGIDYSETDDPLFTGSQALDVFPTQGTPFEAKSTPAPAPKPAPVPRSSMAEISDSILLGNVEPEPPPAKKKHDSGLEATTDKQAFMPGVAPPIHDLPLAHEKTSTDGFLDAAPPARPAPPPATADDADATGGLTFNSLMFGGAQPALPPAAPKKDASAEDLTNTSFERQYSNVMFGTGAEETSFAPAPPAEAVKGAEEETLVFRNPSSMGSKAFAPATPPPPAEVSADEVTSIEPPKPDVAAAIIGTPKVSMFERQRDAGKEAIAAEDYARAVQCLSVAASLKPSDKEVRELLEEARKKRRGV